MKLLYIGVCAGSESMPKYFAKRFDDYQDVSPGSALNTQIKFYPDVILYQIQTDNTNGVKSVDIVKYFNNNFPDAYKLNWMGDKRNNTEPWFFEAANYVDITCFSNEIDVNNLKQAGYNSDFLQIGIDEDIFTPKGDVDQRQEILFMANNHGGFPLSPERQRVADILRKNFGNRFGLYGINWKHANGNFMGDEKSQRLEAAVYRGGKIGISVSNYNAERYTSDRLLRAMGSGIMVISHRYPGIEKDFEVGEELVTYEDFDDLIKKCNYYLESPYEREEIARKGCEKVHNNLTYNNMIDNIKNMYYENRN